MPWTVNMKPDDILTIKDVAEFLRLPASSVYKLAQDGKIPGVKVGKHWRFLKKDLELLFEQKREDHPQIPEGKK
jgi:excisionase family DNA binding protein